MVLVSTILRNRGRGLFYHYHRKENCKSKNYIIIILQRRISSYDSDVHVKAFSHSFVPRESLRTLETLQINLKKEENELLMDMHKTTRRQIRRAEEQRLEHIVLENPTDQDLLNISKVL